MKIAIVHDWLDKFGGSERVLEQIINLYPDADIFSLVEFLPKAERAFLGGRTVRTSFLQHMPFARRNFRHYLGLMPYAIESFDLSSYDLILSSSHSIAKGVLTGPNQVHVSYVNTPMRYAWDLRPQYLQNLNSKVSKIYASWLLHRLRLWDVQSANGVDVLIANSHAIARRIYRAYRRDSIVVHPPVDLESFYPTQLAQQREAYLVLSRLVPYKKVDLIVSAFAVMPERRLIIIGDGPERGRLQKMAGPCSNISWRHSMPEAELARQLRECRALIHAAEEDFGIALVEAQASGTPVIAYGRGGARDIIMTGPKPTGLLFEQQTPEAIIEAVERFEQLRIEPQICRDNALRFSQERFRRSYVRAVELALQRFSHNLEEAEPWREAG